MDALLMRCSREDLEYLLRYYTEQIVNLKYNNYLVSHIAYQSALKSLEECRNAVEQELKNISIRGRIINGR